MTQGHNMGANICRHLKRAALETPASLAVAVQKKHRGRLTYEEMDFTTLDRESDRIAKALDTYGIRRGMKAVLMVTPSLEFFALTSALFKVGIIPILVDPGMGIRNLKQCFIESAPDAFIGIPKAHIARRLFAWGKPSVRFLLTVNGSGLWGGASLTQLVKRVPADANYKMAHLEDDEMAAILFTSGSTGPPKGVVYTHTMFEAQISALKDDYGITQGERDLATFPLFSLFGPALGMASVIPDMDASKPITANPEHIFSAIEQYQCSNMFVNPALIERLAQAGVEQGELHSLPSIRRVISAGAPANINSISRFSKMLSPGVEVLNSYGATESLPLTQIGSETLLSTSDITDNGGGICVGKPVRGVNIAIIEITDAPIPSWDNNLRLASNQIGEIVVKGPMVSSAYYHRDSATEQAKIIDGDSVRHRMGDLGYLDEQGKLWMCGRKAHAVHVNPKSPEHRQTSYFSIPCERIFNIHPKVKRTALVGVEHAGELRPLLCVELEKEVDVDTKQLFTELKTIGAKHSQTSGIRDFLVHPDFPVDIRHNAKIFREKLAVWAQRKIQGSPLGDG